VQLIKYQVLREVARLTYKATLEEKKSDIALVVDPGPAPRIRCYCSFHCKSIDHVKIWQVVKEKD